MRNNIMKVTWLILAVISLGIGVFETIGGRFKESYRFFIFFLIAISLFFYRKTRPDPELKQKKQNQQEK